MADSTARPGEAAPAPDPVAGPSKSRDATYGEALSSFNLSESLGDRFARVPCQRKALTFGLLGGGSVFLIRWLMTRRLQNAGNWGVGSVVFLSAASYHNCTSHRRREELLARQIVDKVDEVNSERRRKGLPPIRGMEYTTGTGEEGVGGERRREPREPRVVNRRPMTAEEEWKLRTGAAEAAKSVEVKPADSHPSAEGDAGKRKKWLGIW